MGWFQCSIRKHRSGPSFWGCSWEDVWCSSLSASLGGCGMFRWTMEIWWSHKPVCWWHTTGHLSGCFLAHAIQVLPSEGGATAGSEPRCGSRWTYEEACFCSSCPEDSTWDSHSGMTASAVVVYGPHCLYHLQFLLLGCEMPPAFRYILIS